MIRRRFVLLPIAFSSAFVLAGGGCITNPSLGTGGADGGAPGTVPPVTPPANDAGSSGGPATPDSGPSSTLSCDGVLAAMLAAPLTPPNIYATFNLTSGRDPKGLTIDEADSAKCAVFSTDPVSVGMGGYRSASWGTADDVDVSFNMQSRIIESIVVGKNYKGVMHFNSRVGGNFGAHTYELGISRLTRDGVDMPIDWTATTAPWADELLDALMATFSPSTVRGTVNGCKSTGECLLLADDGSGQAYFGARDLAFYVMFAKGTSQPVGFYNFWKGGRVDCTTPIANLEAMDYNVIAPGFVGATQAFGPEIGGLNLAQTKPNGITWQDANAVECNGQSVAAPDPGYAAIQWGGSGELVLEYNTTSNLVYKVFAKSGYKGSLDVDDGTNAFSIAIGSMTKAKAPFVIDWTNAVASVTPLSNSVNYATDTDCVAAGNCTITLDDGKGHSIVEFPFSAVGVIFAKGTSVPQSIYATWDKGK